MVEALGFEVAGYGLGTIAVTVGEEPDTIEEAYEPFLIMNGYLERTPKGRVATARAFAKVGLKVARDYTNLPLWQKNQ